MSKKAKNRNDYYNHARKRAFERYGLSLTRENWEQMNLKIQSFQALWLMKESNQRTHFLVDDQYIVVYEKSRKGIVTFLPPECIYNYLPGKAS